MHHHGSTSRAQRFAFARPAATLMLLVATLPVSAKVYHVSADGSDRDAGTEGQPWGTIQTAAERVKPGDTCIVHTGVYRETVRPARSGTADQPITFAVAVGEKVLITGTEQIADWTRHEGNIYEATVDWPVEQVFVDRRRMVPAQYPNAGDDPYELRLLDAELDGDVCVVPGLADRDISWAGGVLWAMNQRAWVARSARIAGSQGTRIRVEGKPPFRDKGKVRLYGVLASLDSEREWHQSDDTLYLWPPAGNPAGRRIEATKRRWAFDLEARSHVRIEGFEIFAASINLHEADHCEIEHCRVRYASFDGFMKGGFNRDGGMGPDTEGLGLVVGGHDNVVRSCEIAYCIGDGISVYGEDNRVENCVVHDCDLSATDCAPIDVTGRGHTVAHCTAFNAGRSVLLHRKLRAGRIHHNHLYNAGLMTNDLGATYTFATDGEGTVLAYNRVHDVHCHVGIGIYVDNFSPNHVVHHNLCYDCEDCGIRLNTPTRNVLICNNTVTRNGKSLGWWGQNNNSDQPDTRVINNIMTDSVALGEGAVVGHNFSRTEPAFIDPANEDFRLAPASPCIDAGVALPEITTEFEGPAPDIGCYEFGADPWRAGSNLRPEFWYTTGW